MSRGENNFVTENELYNEILQIVRDNEIESPDQFLKNFILFVVQVTEGKHPIETGKINIYELLRWAINQYKNNDPTMVYFIQEGKKCIVK